MHRVSGLDALFLYLETPTTPMHVAGLAICEPVDASRDCFAQLRAQVAAKLHNIPSFTRVLIPAPLGIDHPVWETPASLDLDYHIRKVAVPRPGGMADILALVEDLHTRRLSRRHPLWQFTFIEGLPDGRFALYLKSHHACLDGVGGAIASELLGDKSPIEYPALSSSRVRLAARKPGYFERLGLALGSLVQQQVNLAASAPALVTAAAQATRHLFARHDADGEAGDTPPVPRTVFNGTVKRERTFGVGSLPLAQVHALAKALGGTVNDVLLAVCGGALRRHLARRDLLPPEPLSAMVPVSLHEAGGVDQSNHLTFVFARLGTHIADPLERLAAVRAGMGRLKRVVNDVRTVMPNDFSFAGAPFLLPMLWKTIEDVHLAERIPPFLNLIVSNVPGPRKAMYFAGAEVKAYYPVSVAAHGVGLNVTFHSYAGQVHIGVIAARNLCPSAQGVADDFLAEFAAMHEAHAARSARKARRRKPGRAKGGAEIVPLPTAARPPEAATN